MSRDRQRQKVYDWENTQSWMIKKSYLTKDECNLVIKRLNNIYKKNVKLRFKNGHGSCWAINQRDILIRNRWGRSYAVLIHEYSHCITNDSHNGNFVSEYCIMLHHLHPEQPSIKDLVKSLNDANVDFADFEKTLSRKRLSKRYKPFKDVSTDPIIEPVKIIKKRVSAKQRVQILLEKWGEFYEVSEYEYYSTKFVNINGMEHSDVLDSWLEVEGCLLNAIKEKLHNHKDYQID